MISESLLRVVLAVEATIALAALVLVIGHALALRWRTRRGAALLAEARVWLAGRLADPGKPDEGPPVALSPRLRAQLLEDVAPSIGALHATAISGAAGRLGLVGPARRQCRSPFWWRRLRAAHRLITYGMPLPPELLDDRHPAVRAQAAEQVGDRRDPEAVPRLVDMLADPAPLCRHVAKDALVRCGPVAVSSLAQRLEGQTSPVSTSAALEVAVHRPDPAYAGAAGRLAGHADAEVRRRAASLLGAVGGPAATEALLALLDDESPEVRSAAALAAGRLGHWPAAPALARLLADPEWEPSRSAADALSRLGAPGLLLLRQHARSEGRRGLLAQQALDLAALRAPSQGPP